MNVDNKASRNIPLKDIFKCLLVPKIHISHRRPYLFALAVIGLSFAACISGQIEPTPTIVVATATKTPTSKPKTLSPGEGYDMWLAWLKDSVLRYKSLQGPPMQPNHELFYDNRTKFLVANGGNDNLPFSMIFTNQYGETISVANADAPFRKGAFSMSRPIEDGSVELCTQPSELRANAYRKLAEEFEKDRYIDRGLLEDVIGGASPDCGYFNR